MIISIAISALAVVAVMAVAFTVGRILGRYRDIDVFWPLGFVAVAVVGFFASAVVVNEPVPLDSQRIDPATKLLEIVVPLIAY